MGWCRAAHKYRAGVLLYLFFVCVIIFVGEFLLYLLAKIIRTSMYLVLTDIMRSCQKKATAGIDSKKIKIMRVVDGSKATCKGWEISWVSGCYFCAFL